MSVQALSWAFAQNITPASRKLVLIALCNRADEEGFCYPSLEWLAGQSSQEITTCKRAISDLIDAGLIEKTNRYKADGSQTSNLYRVVMGGGVQVAPGGSAVSTRGGVQLAPQDENINKIKKIGRDDFLRSVDQAIINGDLDDQKTRHNLTDDLIRMAAGDAHDYWSQKDKFPTGEPLAAFRGWLRMWQADKVIRAKQAEATAPKNQPQEKSAASDAAVWRARLDGYAKKKFWLAEKWGPPPGDPRCWAPPELVTEYLNKTEKELA